MSQYQFQKNENGISAAATHSSSSRSHNELMIRNKGEEGSKGLSGGPPTNMSMLARGLWLIRVPPDVAAAWETLPDNTEVGNVTIRQNISPYDPKSVSGSGNLQDTQILLSLKNQKSLEAKSSNLETKEQSSLDIFDKYKLMGFGDASSAPIIAVDANNDAEKEPKVAGSIKKKLKAFPVRDEAYKKHLIQKEKQMREHRQPIQLERAVNCYKPVADHQNNIEHRKKKRLEGRKCRSDSEEVIQNLFAVFESHQFYSFKDLVKLTNQPASFLKEILKEYCNFCTKGTNRSLWELKPEYRHYESDKMEEA